MFLLLARKKQGKNEGKIKGKKRGQKGGRAGEREGRRKKDNLKCILPSGKTMQHIL